MYQRVLQTCAMLTLASASWMTSGNYYEHSDEYENWCVDSQGFPLSGTAAFFCFMGMPYTGKWLNPPGAGFYDAALYHRLRLGKTTHEQLVSAHDCCENAVCKGSGGGNNNVEWFCDAVGTRATNPRRLENVSYLSDHRRLTASDPVQVAEEEASRLVAKELTSVYAVIGSQRRLSVNSSDRRLTGLKVVLTFNLHTDYGRNLAVGRLNGSDSSHRSEMATMLSSAYDSGTSVTDCSFLDHTPSNNIRPYKMECTLPSGKTQSAWEDIFTPEVVAPMLAKVALAYDVVVNIDTTTMRIGAQLQALSGQHTQKVCDVVGQNQKKLVRSLLNTVMFSGLTLKNEEQSVCSAR